MMSKTKRSFGETVVRSVAVVFVLFTLGYVAKEYVSHNMEQPKMVIADTPVVIEDIKPIGELYLYTTVTEDFERDSFTGSGLFGSGFLTREHQCIQILRQQVSFTMDMDEIVYEEDSVSHQVIVTLPKLRFIQSTIYPWFKSDNENEEGAVKYDAAPLIDKVEAKIRKKYDTKDNREAAMRKAKEVLKGIFGQCGKEVVFK